MLNPTVLPNLQFFQSFDVALFEQERSTGKVVQTAGVLGGWWKVSSTSHCESFAMSQKSCSGYGADGGAEKLRTKDAQLIG